MSFIDMEDFGTRWTKFDNCSCKPCASSCHKIPGIYDPKHLLCMIESGEVTMAELVPNLVEDMFLAEGDISESILFLRPRIVNEIPGGMAPLAIKSGKCVNLTSTGCSLKRKLMPVECLTTYNCQKKAEGILISKNDVPTIWTTLEAKKIIKMFEDESKKQNPNIKLGLDEIKRQDREIRENPFLGVGMLLEMFKMELGLS